MVEPRNTQVLADALFSLLSNKEKAQEFSINAYNRVTREFSSKKMIDDYREICNEAMSAK